MKKYSGEKEEEGLREQILNRLYLFIGEKEELESATSMMYLFLAKKRKVWVVSGMILGALLVLILTKWST